MGGQSIPNLDWDLGVFVAKSFIRNIALYVDIKHLLNKNSDQIKRDFVKPLDEYLMSKEYGRIINKEGKELIRKHLKYIEHYEFDQLWEYALEKTDRDTYQAMESLTHNLCTLASRAGSQVPFSSVNVGLDTSEEGRMVTKNLFLAQDAGLGSGETAIFPISVMKMKKGITDPGSVNYDLFKLACKTSAKRLFPEMLGHIS